MADFDTANIYQRLMRLLKYGNIHSVQAKPPRCRVTFGIDPVSGTEHVSDWLNWSTRSDSEVNDWSMPAVGAQVMVLSPGGETDNGLVFPAGFSDDRPPPATEPGKHVTKYGDGATVMYDSSAHQATVTLPDGGKVTVVAVGGILLKGDTTVDGNFTVTGKSDVAGDSTVGGNFSCAKEISDQYGTVNAIRVTYNGHNHKENGDGGGTTDGPNQPLPGQAKAKHKIKE